MAYMQGRVAHDADSHVMETREWLDRFVDKEYADKVRQLYGPEPGRIDKLLESAKARKGDAEAEAKARENAIAGEKGWRAYGAFDPAERTKVLDDLGFASQLVFPTGGIGQATRGKDINVRYAASRAYNRAIADFGSKDKRLIGVAYVPLDDVTLALEGIKEALADGCGAVMIAAEAAGERSPGHPELDPIWNELSERNIPFMLHIGPGTKTQPMPYRNNGRPRAPDTSATPEMSRSGPAIQPQLVPTSSSKAMKRLSPASASKPLVPAQRGMRYRWKKPWSRLSTRVRRPSGESTWSVTVTVSASGSIV